MRNRVVEAWSSQGNWGKFLVGVYDVEWDVYSVVSRSGRPLLREVGGFEYHSLLVQDLQTRVAVTVTPPTRPPEYTDQQWNKHAEACAQADLDRNQIWVCPLYRPFLGWLYRAAIPFDALPRSIKLDTSLQMRGVPSNPPGDELTY